MANTATLALLLGRVAAAADMKTFATDTCVTKTQATDWINDGLSKLYDLLVEQDPDRFVTKDNVTLVVDQENYSLPSDFRDGRSVFYVESGTRHVLEQFQLEELATRQDMGVVSRVANSDLHYRYLGNEIWFTPTPAQGGTVELWYVPHMTALAADADVVNVGYVPRWEDYVVSYAAARCRIKEETDPSSLWLLHKDAEAQIKKSSARREQGRPQRVARIRHRYEDDGWEI